MAKLLLPFRSRVLRVSMLALFLGVVSRTGFPAETSNLEDQTRAIATELRCVVCQNLSVADSPSEMAQQMRGVIREQLQAGKKPEEIKNYFVSKYGEWVLLAPSKHGISLAVWVLPFIALASGLGLGLWFLRRWTKRPGQAPVAPPDDAVVERVRAEAAQAENLRTTAETVGAKSELEQDRARLYTDLNELEFDFQAGKLSEADYRQLKGEIESRAASVLRQLDARPKIAPRQAAAPARKKTAVASARGLRGWQLAAGGVFLLLFGLTLGIFLTQSLRPRQSEQDTLTGGFLTGTAAANSAGAGSALEEGKAAFEKQDWPKAIEAFKKVLAADPNQPEAHTYMGFILIQAGHADGALMAFDKALAGAPNFPMALWGKGMTLYKEKQDYAGAREVLGKLAAMMAPGEERGEIEKVLAEIPAGGGKSVQQTTAAAAPADTGGHISGKITIDPKLTGSIDSQAALFIIARTSGGQSGPPLAVKKVDHPVFPVSYSLGPENVMMQGTPFQGQLSITVRLDKDGNPITRQPGDLTGEYKSPVNVGSKNIDIVLDQVAK